ncbi:hypothetical protein [Polaribacter sp. HL-MS24]|uniref:hypothetical protein n=1 Tax=Polaribacter sp. HL-MS24 TaxID=3077735 RepID=UPI0029341D57|nr:hypothetical protein [Polaribacter sp. HL-MS24]WOC40880.1 hypothetical protein RRF69_03650 [Polaribacter sp. HL-MS24]
MKTIKIFRSILMLSAIVLLTFSCEEELTEYPTIVYQSCDDPNVVKDTNILTDFQCQANVELTGVETVRNPSESGVNKSKFVGKTIDGPDAWDALVIDYGSPIDLSTHGVFKMKVRTEVSGILKVKLEGGTSTPIEKDNTIELDSGWTEYEFNFSSEATENHTKLVIFFNAGVESSGTDEYFIDDLFWDKSIDPCEGVTADLSIISDFQCQQNRFLGDKTKETSAPVVDNPDKSGINESEFVGKYTDDGTNAWDNLLIDFEEEIDLSTNSQLKVKIHSSKTVPLLAKLEGGTAMEIWGSIDQTDKWVEYTFDFRAAAGNGNTKVVLFFNGGKSDGATEDVYYIDDLKFAPWVDPCIGIPADLSIISDFECQQNYTFQNDSAPVVANPNKSGENTSDFVGEFTDDGTNAWDNLLVDFGAEIDLSSNNQLNIKVLSDKSVPILAKLEGGTVMEIWGTIDVTGDWKNYTFDFSAAAGNGNTKVVLFFNGGQTDGTATDKYYIDDFKFSPMDCSAIVENCAGVTQDLSIVNDFDCQQNFDGVNTIPIVTNPNASCENRSSNVGKYTDDGTNPWDNLLIDFGAPIDLSTKNQLKFKVLSTKTVPILAKIEGGTAQEIRANITVVDKWVEYAFDFSSSAGAGNTKLVLFFNAGETNGTATDDYFIDDIRFEAP